MNVRPTATIPAASGNAGNQPVPPDELLRDSARKLEASFLAEMLKQSGFGKPLKSFGGGVGEEAFASFAVDQIAQQLESQGGFGLAESIFESLKRAAKP